MGEEPKVAPDPWSLMNSFANAGSRGRGLTPYQQARLQMAQQKLAQQRQAQGNSSPINLDALQDAQQDKQDYGYTPDVGGSYAGIAPITSGGVNNQLPTFARGGSASNSGGYDPVQVANIITQQAQARGIDPSVPLAVIRGEGGLTGKTGDNGSSFGPLQLHYGGVAPGGNNVGGMGDDFTAKYHEQPSPDNFNDQAAFALDQAQAHGWGAWHGYHGGQWDGIPRNGQPINLDQQSANVPTPPPRPQDMGVQSAQDMQMQQQPQQVAQNDPQQAQDDGDSTDPTTRLSWLL